MLASTDRLKPGFSLYCDLLRFLAASVVLLGHASWTNVGPGFLWQTRLLGSPSVVVFFVLSGYIICYVSFTRETTLLEYSAARLARLYSVVIPAVIFTLVLDSVGRAYNPITYQGVVTDFPIWRSLCAIFFLSDFWFAQVQLFSNTAYWSLPFEFWYYVLFGSALLLRGKLRVFAIVFAGLIAGPRILITFPIWLAGAGAYLMFLKAPAKRMSGLLFAVSLAIIVLGVVAKSSELFWRNLPHFLPNEKYLPPQITWPEYITGAGVAIHLYAASHLDFGFLQRFKTGIRLAAGFTFSLYLFHLPILFFAAAFIPPNVPPLIRYTSVLSAALLGSAALSYYTESRKDQWRKRFIALFRRN